MKARYLVVAIDHLGRIRAWAQGTDLDAVKKSVDARWPTSEQRDHDEVHIIKEDGSVTPHIGS